MINTIDIAAFVYDRLSQVEDLEVYPVVAEQKTTIPFAIYWREGMEYRKTKDGIYEAYITYGVHIYTQTYKQGALWCQSAIEKLRPSGTAGTQKVTDFELEDCSEAWTDDIYIQRITFSYRVS